MLVPDVDERSIRTDDPYKLPLRLAEAKAKNLLPKISEPSLLITVDTIVICCGKVYEKPVDANEVRAFLRDFCEEKYTDIVTTVLVTNTATGKEASGTDICKVEFDPIPEGVVEEFIRTGDPYSRAGGFSVENDVLAPYIQTMPGATYDSIMGLPVELLKKLLEETK